MTTRINITVALRTSGRNKGSTRKYKSVVMDHSREARGDGDKSESVSLRLPTDVESLLTFSRFPISNLSPSILTVKRLPPSPEALLYEIPIRSTRQVRKLRRK